mmetsp:Transcript_54744/g.152780  ORF Transcript_54744/g.152780 Transcript_54744/m.152780 type:complete len:251 (+) Transcript_54744:1270-2022(+)
MEASMSKAFGTASKRSTSPARKLVSPNVVSGAMVWSMSAIGLRLLPPSIDSNVCDKCPVSPHSLSSSDFRVEPASSGVCRRANASSDGDRCGKSASPFPCKQSKRTPPMPQAVWESLAEPHVPDVVSNDPPFASVAGVMVKLVSSDTEVFVPPPSPARVVVPPHPVSSSFPLVDVIASNAGPAAFITTGVCKRSRADGLSSGFFRKQRSATSRASSEYLSGSGGGSSNAICLAKARKFAAWKGCLSARSS